MSIRRSIPCPGGPPWDGGVIVVSTLMTAGHEAWFVGGCVRDLLLGDAVQDVDVTTSAHPQQVEALFSRTVAVGRSFGVVVVVLPDGRQVEVATFRNDGAYIDGRRPASVTFGTAVEDVQRRDFTINALLLSPVDGTVVDHVGGLEDLHARILRMVGDADRRIAEDRLRILRGLRFAARFHLQIEAGTWRALCANTLGGLSAERIVQEWTKALSGPGLVRWLDLLATSGHLHALYPGGACPTPGARQDIARALDRLVVGSPLVVRQALWLHTTPLPLVEAWLGSLPGSRRQQEHLRWLLAQPAPEQVATWPLARRRRLLQHADCPDLLEFWRCRDGDGPVLADLRRDVEEERRQGPWTPLVRARDLIAIGCPPGPALGRVLAQTEDAQLEKLFTTAEGGLAFARTCIAATGDRQNLAGKSLPER